MNIDASEPWYGEKRSTKNETEVSEHDEVDLKFFDGPHKTWAVWRPKWQGRQAIVQADFG
jgi:hypothetical protein